MKGQRATLRKLRVELKLSKFEFSLIRGQRFNQLALTSGPILKITGEQTIAVQVITNLILFTMLLIQDILSPLQFIVSLRNSLILRFEKTKLNLPSLKDHFSWPVFFRTACMLPSIVDTNR